MIVEEGFSHRVGAHDVSHALEEVVYDGQVRGQPVPCRQHLSVVASFDTLYNPTLHAEPISHLGSLINVCESFAQIFFLKPKRVGGSADLCTPGAWQNRHSFRSSTRPTEIFPMMGRFIVRDAACYGLYAVSERTTAREVGCAALAQTRAPGSRGDHSIRGSPGIFGKSDSFDFARMPLRYMSSESVYLCNTHDSDMHGWVDGQTAGWIAQHLSVVYCSVLYNFVLCHIAHSIVWYGMV